MTEKIYMRRLTGRKGEIQTLVELNSKMQEQKTLSWSFVFDAVSGIDFLKTVLFYQPTLLK